MDKKALILAFVGLAVGAAIGYFSASSFAPEVRPSLAESLPKRTSRAADADRPSDIAALRRRVHELERRLAETTASASAITNAVPLDAPNAAPPDRGPPSMASFRERMEEMKKNDPERYAQMTNRMAQWRSQRLEQAQNRMEFLASLDTSAMSPKELENHEKLQDLIARREELMQMMRHDDPNVTDEQREKAHREMRETWQQLHQLEDAERDMLLRQTARNLGCKGPMAKELVETIKTIYDATQSHGPHGPRGGHRGPPPGRR